MPRYRSGMDRLLTLASLAIALAASPQALANNEHLWSLLKDRGVVVLMRPAVTTPGVGDPPGMRIGDCASQRNLTDEGRRQAKAIGEVLRARSVSFERVLSSPTCRCLDTAQLAFGRVDDMSTVTNQRGGHEEMPRQVREMRALVGERRRGGNVVLVSDGTNIAAVTGITPEHGEMLVIVPQGDGKFEVRGRLMIQTPRPGAPVTP